MSSNKSIVYDLSANVNNNEQFRRILTTTKRSQLVMMTLQPKQEIGLETHDGDQFIYIQEGNGTLIMNNDTYKIYPGVGFIIPSGTRHNVISDNNKLKLFTIYAPPEH